VPPNDDPALACEPAEPATDEAPASSPGALVEPPDAEQASAKPARKADTPNGLKSACERDEAVCMTGSCASGRPPFKFSRAAVSGEVGDELVLEECTLKV
jgi:hypothetical protein